MFLIVVRTKMKMKVRKQNSEMQRDGQSAQCPSPTPGSLLSTPPPHLNLVMSLS